MLLTVAATSRQRCLEASSHKSKIHLLSNSVWVQRQLYNNRRKVLPYLTLPTFTCCWVSECVRLERVQTGSLFDSFVDWPPLPRLEWDESEVEFRFSSKAVVGESCCSVPSAVHFITHQRCTSTRCCCSSGRLTIAASSNGQEDENCLESRSSSISPITSIPFLLPGYRDRVSDHHSSVTFDFSCARSTVGHQLFQFKILPSGCSSWVCVFLFLNHNLLREVFHLNYLWNSDTYLWPQCVSPSCWRTASVAKVSWEPFFEVNTLKVRCTVARETNNSDNKSYHKLRTSRRRGQHDDGVNGVTGQTKNQENVQLDGRRSQVSVFQLSLSPPPPPL